MNFFNPCFVFCNLHIQSLIRLCFINSRLVQISTIYTLCSVFCNLHIQSLIRSRSNSYKCIFLVIQKLHALREFIYVWYSVICILFAWISKIYTLYFVQIGIFYSKEHTSSVKFTPCVNFYTLHSIFYILYSIIRNLHM